jgi:hypothetical protein
MSNFYNTFLANGGATFTLTAPIDAFITDGKVKPTNSYYGNSQVFRPEYRAVKVPKGTVLVSCPGGMWFVMNGRLVGFSLDDRNPDSIGVFEKHYNPTNDRLFRHYEAGTVKLVGKGMTTFFNQMYDEWRRNQS